MSRRVCAIVGAGEGLGRALSAKFAAQGFDIALISRSEANSAVAIEAAKMASDTVEIRFFSADATKPESMESALLAGARDLGEIDILIYNARGAFTACVPLDMSYAALEDNYRVEVIGAFAAAKSVLPSMINRSRGSVFFSSATAAFRGSASYPLYAIGKFGLRALSQSLAKAYAKDGVHIVHFRLDCDLDVPIMRDLYGDRYDPEKLADPDEVAETYWLTHLQPAGAWSNEVEIRPSIETWTF
ncbi:MAG: SDR family NAD(P)-dependent oxidoreductase [Gammaproteobacteria bacterium]|nr:SDR family NAD(P)-dependent oxidoreductase [Gammaproteobacteria bacterium]